MTSEAVVFGGFLEGGIGAGTFTAGYDVEGRLTSETYPNGMTAKYTFNPASEATGIEYEKTAHCAGTCPEVWFKETTVPSIHGEALLRTSTLAKEEYTYDEAGHLTKVNETPTGKGCKTRIYAYNEDSDRTSETTRESATETCATTGGTEEKHTYDEADRLIDTGVEYEALGNQTKIPAADAGEHEITASFYTDNQVAVQKQNGETTSYSYDPEGRTEKTVSEGTTKASVVNHYPGPGEAISWACEETVKECEEGKGTKWTRDIPGIDGSLGAVEKSGQAAVLQLHDLEGNVIATAAVSETETKLLTTYNPTEFGVPVNGTPPTKYSWLGAGGLATEQASGAANPGGGSYVPQLGAPLQTQPVAPPGAPDGTYVNPYIGSAGSAADFAGDSAYAAGAPGREVARQKAAQEEWERLHPPPPPGAVPSPGEGGPGPLGGSPGWVCEDAEVTGQEVPGCFSGVTEFNEGEAEATTASAYEFSRQFFLPPGEAEAAATFIDTVNHGIVEAPFFPEWATQVLRNMPYIDWDRVADDLFKGATDSAPFGLVEVNIEGTVRPKHFHIFVWVKAISAYGEV